MDIDKTFFLHLEETLKTYGKEKENYKGTFDITADKPAEAYIILALRCRKIADRNLLAVGISASDRDRTLIGNEVRIDFFPRGNYLYFSMSRDKEINKRMKVYLNALKRKYKSSDLDYEMKYINIGICYHCNKNATKHHPDYDFKHICNSCLKQRNRFLVVAQ